MNLTAEKRIDVLDTFAQLQNRLEDFNRSVLEDNLLVVWMSQPPGLLKRQSMDGSPRLLATEVISQLDYVPSQLPREILVCPGFLGASPATIEKAISLNQAKDEFKQAVLNLREAKISLKDASLNEQYQNYVRTREKPLSKALQQMGLAKLHLKQCYRKIPILPHAPSRISWTWAHTRSIKRVTIDQAKALLQKKPLDAGIEAQLKKLSYLPAQEPLAIVQELAPHLRANIVFPANLTSHNRLMVKGPIPILFPADLSTPAPLFKPPKEKSQKDENRLIRNDVRLDPNPFLPAIHAHRYLVETTEY